MRYPELDSKITALAAFFIGFFWALTTSAQEKTLLLPSVNSPEHGQVAPLFDAPRNRLYFARARDISVGDEMTEVWQADMEPDGTFIEVKPTGGPIRSAFSVAVASISADGQSLYLAGKFEKETPPD